MQSCTTQVLYIFTYAKSKFNNYFEVLENISVQKSGDKPGNEANSERRTSRIPRFGIEQRYGRYGGSFSPPLQRREIQQTKALQRAGKFSSKPLILVHAGLDCGKVFLF